MSGNVVNLRLFRKRKERDDRASEAAGNRARHGRTKAERLHEESRRDAADRAHDGRLLGSRPESGSDGEPTPA